MSGPVSVPGKTRSTKTLRHPSVPDTLYLELLLEWDPNLSLSPSGAEGVGGRRRKRILRVTRSSLSVPLVSVRYDLRHETCIKEEIRNTQDTTPQLIEVRFRPSTRYTGSTVSTVSVLGSIPRTTREVTCTNDGTLNGSTQTIQRTTGNLKENPIRFHSGTLTNVPLLIRSSPVLVFDGYKLEYRSYHGPCIVPEIRISTILTVHVRNP